MPTFSDWPLRETLKKNLAEANHEIPTEIQALALTPALQGTDLIACAQTGCGKTAVYALTILNGLPRFEPSVARALILVPTRELALQVETAFALYGKNTGLRGIAVYGGAAMAPQVMRLRRGVDVIVATPGRLIDHMQQGTIDLSSIQVLVLDEADRLLDMGFMPQVERILEHVPTERQTMLFSATIDDEVEKLARAYLINPEIVNAQPRSTAVAQIEQVVHRCTAADKGELLLTLLHEAREGGGGALVFTRTRHGADRLDQELTASGIRSGCIHGEVSQSQRERVLARFRAGRIEVLVATDVAARGIDVPHITHVINYDVPLCAEDYVHRIGRTGRAGRAGKAFTFVTHGDTPQLRAIERLVGKRLDPNPPDPSEFRGPAPRGRFGGPGRGGDGYRGGWDRRGSYDPRFGNGRARTGR
ncbi:MAG: DEAD/DEAH box helicase [Capsulimonadaceae bacterium]